MMGLMQFNAGGDLDLKMLGLLSLNLERKWLRGGLNGRERKFWGYWKEMKKSMRQLNKGMGANMDGEMKREREMLLRKIKIMDNKAKLMGLSEEDWGERYKMEGQLEDIFAYEEQVWQQRSNQH
jgi:hypothetical protein